MARGRSGHSRFALTPPEIDEFDLAREEELSQAHDVGHRAAAGFADALKRLGRIYGASKTEL